MTPAREALAEAARAETARIYGSTLREHRVAHELPGVSVGEFDRIIDERRASAERPVRPLRAVS